MQITTQHSYGDRFWAVAHNKYDKGVPCSSCHGKGGADIPGTKVRVECQDCSGTGERTGTWHSFDVWFVVVRGITVRADWGREPEVRYDVTGIWDDGQERGHRFGVAEGETFPDKEAAVRWATEQGGKYDDATIRGVQVGKSALSPA